ncbi:hypothetical protein [Actinocorallia aurantiaca]|jgi:hypothetical protein|uniref:Uncharacterized protein n=1 Tax=Actinocorallia aurantiaca TaxID=46204 RepID=A0ABN3U7G1_9ACTN
METTIRMVCLECSSPLAFTETWVDGELGTLLFEHPLRPGSGWDHDPLPALADPEDHDGKHCDCCGIAAPRPEGFVNTWTVDPDRPVRVRIGDRTFDYSSPWSVCAACSAAIADDDLRLLLMRNSEYGGLPESCTPEQREAGLSLARELLLAFLAARPRIKAVF